jgi:hypothetical protein
MWCCHWVSSLQRVKGSCCLHAQGVFLFNNNLVFHHQVAPILHLPYRCALFDLRFSRWFFWGFRCSGMWFQTFWRSWGLHLEPLRMKVAWFVKYHELLTWMTQCHMPTDLDPQQRYCENIKPCILLLLFTCSWM